MIQLSRKPRGGGGQFGKRCATSQDESGLRILRSTRLQRAAGQAGRITRVIAAAICSHRERSTASRLRPVDVRR
jgi:hypothetical protein